MENELNKDDIFLLDVFHLNYYGINVFFQVCKTDYDNVCVYEMATKVISLNGIKYDMLTKGLKPSKNPFVVPKSMNTYSKSNYKVYPVRLDGYYGVSIPIEINFNSPLYNKAILMGEEQPIIGTAYAFPIREYVGKCWARKDESERIDTNFN